MLLFLKDLNACVWAMCQWPVYEDLMLLTRACLLPQALNQWGGHNSAWGFFFPLGCGGWGLETLKMPSALGGKTPCLTPVQPKASVLSLVVSPVQQLVRAVHLEGSMGTSASLVRDSPLPILLSSFGWDWVKSCHASGEVI